MKKLLLFIFGIFFGLIGFSSAETSFFDNTYRVNNYITSLNPIITIQNTGSFSVLLTSFGIDNGFCDLKEPYISEFISILSGYGFTNVSFVPVYSDCEGYLSFDGFLLTPGSSLNIDVSPFSSNFSYSEYLNFSYPFYCSLSINNSSCPFSYVTYSVPNDTFTVNYGSTSKEYTITEDIDIFINSPVVKNGNTFTFDGSTGINLVYNGSYNWYTKNKLYLGGQFWFKQGVFTPICM